MMKRFVLVKFFLLTTGTLADMNIGCGHWLLQ